MKAGFAEIDITPAPGTKKGGWMQDLEAREFLDPLFARVAMFENGAEKAAFIQLDLLSLRWTHVNDIRQRIESAYGFPGRHVMVACAHNHAGPATAGLDPVPRQEVYNEELTGKCVQAFGQALGAMEEARVGTHSVPEFGVAFNRRVVFRDGTVRTQCAFNTPGALYGEGPIDPEVAVIGVQNAAGQWLGCLVNFACHPVHHGGTTEISAGFPGVLAARMKAFGCPVTLYLNGAYGNVITACFTAPEIVSLSKEEAGDRLSADVSRALGEMELDADVPVGAIQNTIELDYRTITEDEAKGRVTGAQRFRDDELYEGHISRLVQQIRSGKRAKADVQVSRVGDRYLAGIPAEYFVEYALQIKLGAHPKHALVVGGANGMLGYVPTREAFTRGGYETTLGPPSRMAPDTGDRLADEAVRLIKEL